MKVLRALFVAFAWVALFSVIASNGFRRSVLQSIVEGPMLLAYLVLDSPAILALVAVALGSMLAAFGTRTTFGAIGAALVRPASAEPASLVRFGDALALAGRSVLAAGVAGALVQQGASLAWVAAIVEGREMASPARMASGISGVLLMPLVALFLGRCVLLPQARALHVAGGAPRRRATGPWADLALLVFVFPALLVLPMAFARFQ